MHPTRIRDYNMNDVNSFWDDLIVDQNDRAYRNKFRWSFQGKIDPQSLDAKKWLQKISDATYHKTKDWDASERRAWKKMSKMAKNMSMETGHLLISQFFMVGVNRDEVVTETIDSKEIAMDDFTRNPYDFDYGISPDAMHNAFQEIWDNKKNSKWEICAVTTRDASQAPACSHCEGQGFFRCEKCGGSGLVDYDDGMYASGVKRTRKGKCPDCYGNGKIQCKACNGSGKLQLFSNQYQIVKKFKDVKKLDCVAYRSTSWDDTEKVVNSDDEYRTYNAQLKYVFDNHELKEGIYKLYKNEKEILIDAEQTLPNEIGAEYRKLYENNKNAALKEGKRLGKLVCLVGKHIALPIYRISFEADYSNYEIDIYEYSGKVRCIFNDFSTFELSFFKSLFI